MNKPQQKRFDILYQKHVKALKLQGKAKATIDAYSRAVRRIAEYFDRCPDRLSVEDLKDYFSSLVQSHSWSTVKLDRSDNAPANPTLPPSLAVAMACSFSISMCLTNSGTGLILSNLPRCDPYRIFSPPRKWRY